MTNNQTPIDHLAAHLLELLEHDIDTLELLTYLRPLMTPTDFAATCSQLELCPMHICDERICADDDITECAELRA